MATIADIILEQGRSRANARRRQGEISAGRWTGIGDIVSGTLTNINKEREEAPIRAQNAAIRQAQLDQVQGEQQSNERLRALFSREQPPTQEELIAAAGPERGMALAKELKSLEVDPMANEERMLRIKKLSQDIDLAAHPVVKPEKVDTVDAQGNPISQFVTPEAGASYPKPPETPKTYEIVVKGPNGRPVKKLVTAAELQAGIEQYQEPKSAPPIEQQIADALARGDKATVERLTNAAGLLAGARKAPVTADESMPAEYQNALERAVMSVPDRRRGSVIQHANDLWAAGNKQELGEVIRQAALEGENIDTKNQVRGRMAMVAALDDAKSMIKELQAAGVPTGWLTGNMEDLARKLGTSTNPKYVAFKNRLMDTLIQYRRAATGVAFSERESRDYKSMLPNYSQDLPVNLATIDGLQRAMETNDRVYWENKLGPGGAVLVGAIPSAMTTLLKRAGPGRHTLSDGTVWQVDANGSITQIQ